MAKLFIQMNPFHRQYLRKTIKKEIYESLLSLKRKVKHGSEEVQLEHDLIAALPAIDPTIDVQSNHPTEVQDQIILQEDHQTNEDQDVSKQSESKKDPDHHKSPPIKIQSRLLGLKIFIFSLSYSFFD